MEQVRTADMIADASRILGYCGDNFFSCLPLSTDGFRFETPAVAAVVRRRPRVVVCEPSLRRLWEVAYSQAHGRRVQHCGTTGSGVVRRVWCCWRSCGVGSEQCTCVCWRVS